MIDPGGDAEQLLAEIDKRKLTLEQIWLTHGHMDHVGAAHQIARETGARIIGPHQDDLFWLQILEKQCEMFNFPPVESFTPDQWLKDNDQLILGEHQFDVLHTPGHTPGHIVIIHHPIRTVWVGDVLFKGSIGRTDFPQGNHEDLIHSIKHKLFALPEDYYFVPGHGPGGHLKEEALTNPFLI